MVETGTGGGAEAGKYLTGGTWTIVAGQTSVTAAHSLGYTPTKYSISPTNEEASDAYISAVDATNITISAAFAHLNNMTGSWVAG